MFIVDVNGQKGPNKWGWDVFSLSVNESMNGSLYLNAGGCTVVEEGGKTTQQMMRESR